MRFIIALILAMILTVPAIGEPMRPARLSPETAPRELVMRPANLSPLSAPREKVMRHPRTYREALEIANARLKAHGLAPVEVSR